MKKIIQSGIVALMMVMNIGEVPAASKTKTKPTEVKVNKIEIKPIVKRRRGSAKKLRHCAETEYQFYSVIRNRNRVDVEGYSLQILVLGKACQNSKVYTVIANEQSSLSLKPLGEIRTSEGVCTVQYRDKTRWNDGNVTWVYSSKAGSKYYSWLTILKDSEGKVVNVNSPRSMFEKTYDQIARMKRNTAFTIKSNQVKKNKSINFFR